ncbi:MAG: methyltransferase domain-containing protein [Pseudonocardiaceae bacterium]|nr:methyltransferase domain-containing protein [Pseudonocardiaceae bacterium]
MTTLETEWADYARRLADNLLSTGDVCSAAWHEALAEVPRHVLVPRAYRQDSTGKWTPFDTGQELERVYSPETLITSLAHVEGHESPISSSTKPDLMVRMLETLDIRYGHRVLEIGTGSGYNAALLAHRLGDDCVFSVDIDTELVDRARERLATAGYRPTLRAVDGETGLVEHAPYDRILATCSVSAVPWAWAEQLAPEGAILVDFKLAVSAGNLVHLRRADDRLEGRFTHRWAAFMAMRHDEEPEARRSASRPTGDRSRSTSTPAQPWNETPIVWFLAQLRLPRGVVPGLQLHPKTYQPTAATLSAADGSWAHVSLTDQIVTEAGPSSLWSPVEQAYGWWTATGRPSWERFGLTVRSDGQHWLWLDGPDSPQCWQLGVDR